MIEMLAQLEPATTISWKHFIPGAQIDWLHGERKDLISDEQVFYSSGPSNIIPQAIFSIEEYLWDQNGW